MLMLVNDIPLMHQKGINDVQWCSAEKQKGISAVQQCSIENQKDVNAVQMMFHWEPEGH